MIGVFDSGLGGLTILRAIHTRFPHLQLHYLGDHANVPYGERASDDVIQLTRMGVEHLFSKGAKLVLLGCNTATAVAARPLQQNWLPASDWSGHNLIGIVAPTVEAATQTPWAVTTPQYPQKYNDDVIAVFGTTRTVASDVYATEIKKRCPRVTIIQQACPGLAAAIENGREHSELENIVENAVSDVLRQAGDKPVNRAILGCTHYPLVEGAFEKFLPSTTRLLSQPATVTDSLEDYLARHPEYSSASRANGSCGVLCTTTGSAETATQRASVFWDDAPAFQKVSI